MRLCINDSAPGCGPSRKTYLSARTSKTLEPYGRVLESAELSVTFDGIVHEGRLVLRLAAGPPVILASKGRRMVNVLANVFDAAEARLKVASPRPRGRGEAV